MDNDGKNPSRNVDLRSKAEDIFKQNTDRLLENIEGMSLEETRKVLYELRIHQIELSMQNEELRRIQVELETARSRYFDLYDMAPIGYYTINEKGLILEANLTAATLLAVDRSELTHKPMTRFVRKEDQDIWFLFRKHLHTSQTLQTCELRMVKHDGAEIYVRMEAAVSKDEQGNSVCRIMMSDISHRKMEEAYKDISREILQNLNEPGNLQESMECILFTLKNRTGLDAVAIRLQDGDDFQYFCKTDFPDDFRRAENRGNKQSEISEIRPDQNGNHQNDNPLQEDIFGSGRLNIIDPEHLFISPGGSFWANDACAVSDIPVRNDPRNPQGHPCTQHGYASIALVPVFEKQRKIGMLQFNDRRKGCFTPNIIELLEGIASHIGAALSRKQTEDKLRESEERYRKILETQLQQAQKMEAVGLLAGGVAHDFNNMLGVILGYTQLAQIAIDPTQKLYTNLEGIHNAAQRSTHLIRQLLSFARKQAIAPEVLNLNHTIDNTLKMLRRLIREEINLIWLPGKNLNQVRMDPVQVDQILTNLCINARDAITGIGRITIETKNFIQDEAPYECGDGIAAGEYVQLTVKDDGCGMNQDSLSQIFQPFYTSKGIGLGTGLGLSTVYGIIKQNNGFIQVQSTLGQGTLFNIYLPRHEEKITVDSQLDKSEEIPLSHGETVLLVEDEPELLMMMKLMLERLGYQVLAAGSPAEAIAIAEKSSDRIDILITDVVIPGMNCMEMAKKLESMCPKMKFLFMSGYSSSYAVDQSNFAMSAGFIQKPFSINDMAVKVRSVLEM